MLHKKYIITTLIIALSLPFALFAGGSNETATTTNDGKLQIAVSIIPQKAFVENVGLSHVSVVTEIPSGASPENYEPTAKAMAQLEDADLYFSIGVPTEISSILPRLPQDLPLVDQAAKVRETLPERQIGEGRDPHIWLSPARAQIMVNQIAEELGKLDPDYADYYQKNADQYNDKIRNASLQIKQILSEDEGKSFIVYHPAFGYFADEFNLTMYALEEEGKEASPKQMAQMVEKAKDDGAKVIFYQAEINSRQADAFATEIGGKAIMLDPLSSDYVNNLIKISETFKVNL